MILGRGRGERRGSGHGAREDKRQDEEESASHRQLQARVSQHPHPPRKQLGLSRKCRRAS